MIDWKFILNPSSDNLEIEEPQGWSDSSLEMMRDPVYHGVSVTFGSGDLVFVGDAGQIIKAAYELKGAEASTTLRVMLVCDGEVTFQEDYSLDYNTYKELCGEECTVSISFEEKACFQLVNNNFSKEVDIDKELAFDGTTPLTAYTGLHTEIDLPPVALQLKDRAEGDVTGHVKVLTDDSDWECNGCTDSSWFGWIMPALPNEKFASLGSFVTSPNWEHIRYFGFNNKPPYQVVTTVNTTELLGDVKCDLSNGHVSFRAKGNVVIAATDWDGGFILRLKFFRLPAGLDETIAGNWQQLYSTDAVNEFETGGSGGTFNYDLSDSFDVTVNQGDKFTYGFFYSIARYNEVNSITLNQDASEEGDMTNFFELKCLSLCESSKAYVYLVHELLSRITESISNKCLKVESEYYGRTDSEPTAYAQDGCGGLRALTSGLYIRRADKPTFSLSLSDLLNGLNCIDNIGFGYQKDSGGDDVIKVEKVKYFYQDAEIIRLPFVSSVKKVVNTDEVVSTVKIGYETWQPLRINGLDEFNAQRDFRLKLNNSKAQLSLLSNLVAGGYVIETCRQESFATTGQADTTFDNDEFIICMKRNAYGLEVEQGGVNSGENMVDPNTVYNFRITPLRNLMRWFKSIIGSYRVVDNVTSEIEFVTGTGNYTAKGYFDDACSPEKTAPVPYENMNLSGDDLISSEYNVPIFRPEIITFEYPLSLSDFLTIKANPYGFISYQCGTGEWFKGYLRKLSYKIDSGSTSFELRTKYE